MSTVLSASILKLNVFAALKMTLFPMAVITIFWKDRIGLSLTEILMLQAFFSAASVVMEYPSGYVSDRLGYRRALIVACILGILGWGWYLVATSFWGVLGAELLLGVSYAFISGSDTALLFEILQAENRVELYTRCDGRMVSWAQGGEAAGALAAGIMYSTSPLLPFVAQTGVWVLALGLCLTLHEPRAKTLRPVTSHLSEALGVCRYALRENSGIRSTMLHGMLLGLASFYLVWLIQPYMQYCGVPLDWFGPAWAGANLVVALAAANSHRVQSCLGLAGMNILFFVLVVTAYAGLGLTAAPGGFLFYYLLTAMRGLQGPLMRARLQNASERSNRASILSLHSLLFRLGFVLTGPLVGGLADGQGLPVTFFVVGGLFAVILPVSGRVFVRHNASASG
ncbi:MAG: MFS transporter [Desulfovibrionales bacterium]|nr:MFS transporter [Desulfovibrionales bacterium]